MTSYIEGLKDPRWQRRRLEILQAADFTCSLCEASDKTLHVHHRLYRKGAMPWEYSDQELQCLCEDCHEKTTNTRKNLDAILATMDWEQVAELLGYAQGMQAREMDDDELDRSEWSMTCYSHAEGFAICLGGQVDFMAIEYIVSQEPVCAAHVRLLISKRFSRSSN